MKNPVQLTKAINLVRDSPYRPPLRRGYILIPLALALAWFALSQTAQAFLPPPAPDGGYPNENTAEGTFALFDLTGGVSNTAVGFEALFSNSTGFFNTAIGANALQNNTSGHGNTASGIVALVGNKTGSDNTATGATALQNNTTGDKNTATGAGALLLNTTGDHNTATGDETLVHNKFGFENTATGASALYSNTVGYDNTATGVAALDSNTTGNYNTATGYAALGSNANGTGNTATGSYALFDNSGSHDTAVGFQALLNNTGSNNIALGFNAGTNLTTGDNNIDIGAFGKAAEANTIRIGRSGVQQNAYMQGISGTTVARGVTVIVGSDGQLGTIVSSARFKDEIKPMDKASEAILALKPVTFRYKKELDPDGIPQFGLVAEQVEKVNPDLVARDDQGKVYTVRYEAVNAMLLNEFLKEHRKVEQQAATITQLKSSAARQEAIVAQLKKDFQTTVAALTARLKEQDSKIEKVSAQVEVSKFATGRIRRGGPAPRTVLNNQ